MICVEGSRLGVLLPIDGAIFSLFDVLDFFEDFPLSVALREDLDFFGFVDFEDFGGLDFARGRADEVADFPWLGLRVLKSTSYAV